MKKYTIELSEEQLKLVANCLDDVSRFAMGQWENGIYIGRNVKRAGI